jgi:predicted nucleic acid-binding protein
MTNSEPVCVDASFVVALLTPEAHSERAERLWAGWLRTGTPIFAPVLLAFEVTSVLRKKVQRGLLSQEPGRAALETFVELSDSLELIAPDDLHRRAWELASENRQPNLYDSYYVALAELLDCALWTADERLRRAMPGLAGRIASLSEDTAA